LESKGNWLHAGYHLTTSIVSPALLSFPFAFTTLGWFAGILCLIVGAAVTFYSYNLISVVLEHRELEGNRHLRFRDMATDILGSRWAHFTVAPMQFALCLGTVIFSILVGGQSLKFIYLIYHPNGAMKLYEFIILFGIAMLFLAQMPSFHSLRHINLLSLILCLLYSLCVIVGSIHAGHSKLNPEKDYLFTGSNANKVFRSSAP
jgi:amino acid permease